MTGTRLSKLARKFGVGISTIKEFLQKKNYEGKLTPNTKISPEWLDILQKEYKNDISLKKESEKLNLKKSREKKESVSLEDVNKETEDSNSDNEDVVIVKDMGTSAKKEQEEKKEAKTDKKEKKKDEVFEPSPKKEIKILGKIDLDKEKKAKEEKQPKEEEKKEKEPEKKQAEKPKKETAEEKKQPKEKKQPQKEETPQTTKNTKPDEDKKEKKEKKEEKKQPTQNKKDKKVIEAKDNVDVDVNVVGKIDLEKQKKQQEQAKKEKEKKEKEQQRKKQQKELKRKQEAKKKKEKEEKEKIEKEKAQQKQKRQTPPPTEKKREQKEEQKEEQKTEEQDKEDFLETKVKKLSGPTVVGKIDLPSNKKQKKKPVASSNTKKSRNKKKRKRINREAKNQQADNQQKQPKQPKKNQQEKNTKDKKTEKTKRHKKRHTKKAKTQKKEVSEDEVQKQVKETLARLTGGKQKSKSAKYRRDKRKQLTKKQQEEQEQKEAEKNVLKVTEFVAVNELANMMNVQATQVISTCMSLGLPVTINQRLDAETMTLVADEFGYEVEFISIDVQEGIEEEEEEEKDEDLIPRSPVVTIMGHVDHGKTSLLDYIRDTNVIAGEAGGITQHIGAYSVTLKNKKKITFLDTPGHEAFTAMRARGAQATDLAIIVIAANDNVMPQTVEAINHASAAGVPIVFAINKIDLPGANPDKIKEELAKMNYLVEDWGGKYQSQDISAKHGDNVDELLEKVLLEAEMMELKANPNTLASGTIIDSTLDKGRGYVTKLLVQKGTIKVGDFILAGCYTGKVKAMFNEREKNIGKAGPATPAMILGLNGAPQAGDKFNVMENERKAKEIANRREQLIREQGMRTQKYITLDEIGRRIAIGNFQELNVIVKGDMDGSVEALSDSLIKLSTEEIEVKVIHKGVGQIAESDIMLAAASDAIIIGYQVRPSLGARKLAEKEGIDVRLYSIIYDAIEELKDAMEGMLSPDIKEEILGTAEVQEAFKISKVGTIAGCIVREGKILRSSQVRVIRDGIVVYTGRLGSLKRFKDDVKEVKSGFECGLNIENYNDIKIGDVIESFQEVEVKKKL